MISFHLICIFLHIYSLSFHDTAFARKRKKAPVLADRGRLRYLYARLRDQTSSRIAISAASPRRTPIFTMRV